METESAENNMMDFADDKVELMEVRMLERVKHARRSWNQVCKEEVLDADLNAALNGNDIKQNSVLEKIRARHERIFRHFAFKQAEFVSLSENDRLLLLSKNTQVFIQYVIGRAISAETVAEQLQWLLLSDETSSSRNGSGNTEDERKITLDDLQSFADRDKFDEYAASAESLKNPHLMFPCTGTVALVCLFQTDAIFSALSAPRKIARQTEFVYSCADWAHDIFNSAGKRELMNMMHILHKMATLSESLSLTVDCEKILRLPELVALLAREEGDWVERHLGVFNEAVEQVPFGADFVNEVVMYTLGVPLSKHFIPQGTKVWIERFRRILFAHDEFKTGLSVDEQSETLVPATFAAFALAKAKLEMTNTGNEQFLWALSSSDYAVVKDSFSHLAKGKVPKMKRVSVREWNKTFGLMSEENEKRFSELVDGLTDFLKTDYSFKLMILLAMFTHGVSSAKSMSMRVAAYRYLNALKRHFGVAGTLAEISFEKKVKTALRDVNELSVLLQQVSDTAMAQVQVLAS